MDIEVVPDIVNLTIYRGDDVDVLGLCGGLPQSFESDEVEVGKGARPVEIVGQHAAVPVPIRWKYFPPVNPWDCPVRRAECFDEFRASPPGVRAVCQVS